MIATTLGTLEEAAKEAAGNWQEFDCFSWDKANDLEDSDQFCIVYTRHRDSELLEISNAEAIAERMEPFLDREPCDVMGEHHNHWACGWVDGYSIRVFRDGQVTEAFRTWHDLQTRMADYPVLNEEDYSAKEYEATLANITDAAWRLKRQYDLPDGWGSDVYSWLQDHDSSEIENQDDRGGYPSEESIRRAFIALGYERTDDE
jgi:hypothetical protein